MDSKGCTLILLLHREKKKGRVGVGVGGKLPLIEVYLVILRQHRR